MKTVASDEALGSVKFHIFFIFNFQVTIKFDNLVKKLLSEGKYESNSISLPMCEPTKGKNAGTLKISFKIIPKEEAVSNPVGEGQDEPNHSPVLEKPIEGRSMGEFFKVMPFNLQIGFWLMMRMMKYVLIVGSILLVIVILFIHPAIMLR